MASNQRMANWSFKAKRPPQAPTGPLLSPTPGSAKPGSPSAPSPTFQSRCTFPDFPAFPPLHSTERLQVFLRCFRRGLFPPCHRPLLRGSSPPSRRPGDGGGRHGPAPREPDISCPAFPRSPRPHAWTSSALTGFARPLRAASLAVSSSGRPRCLASPRLVSSRPVPSRPSRNGGGRYLQLVLLLQAPPRQAGPQNPQHGSVPAAPVSPAAASGAPRMRSAAGPGGGGSGSER